MKVSLVPLIEAGIAAFLLAIHSSAVASDITWIAPSNQSAAWIVPANWSGGALPLAGDVAQFNNVGAATLSYSMTHGLNPTPNQANVGAVHVLSTRVSLDLSIDSNSASASSFNYHGATVNGIDRTILANDSGKNLTLKSSGGGAAKVGLSDNLDSIVQVNGSGHISILLPITGINSRLVIQSTGSGQAILSGVNSTYSGGTRINSGTLVIAASNAAGTGTITNSGGTLVVQSGLVLQNQVILSSTLAQYKRQFASAENYNVYSVSSQSQTSASLLAGVAGDVREVATSFQSSSSASNDASRLSDVWNFSGTASDIQVVQLSITSALAEGSFLGWLDGGTWTNAIEGNSATGALAQFGLGQSFASSGISATSDYLGSWGYDVGSGSVWAVLDHGGSFAVIPEPSTLLLLGVSFTLLIARLRRNAGLGGAHRI